MKNRKKIQILGFLLICIIGISFNPVSGKDLTYDPDAPVLGDGPDIRVKVTFLRAKILDDGDSWGPGEISFNHLYKIGLNPFWTTTFNTEEFVVSNGAIINLNRIVFDVIVPAKTTFIFYLVAEERDLNPRPWPLPLDNKCSKMISVNDISGKGLTYWTQINTALGIEGKVIFQWQVEYFLVV